jgi:exodeoxyribonuclease VII large subunit
MNTLSLHQLLEHIRRALALNFPEPIWVRAEIAQIGISRGHRYFDLVQKGDADEPLAQTQAVLWERDYSRLHRTLGLELDALFQAGLEVRLQVRVDFHGRYGLKLTVCDADPSFTLGQLAVHRRQTIEQLRREGLLDKNRQLPMPAVLQRIAVISSERAAGYQDFLVQLSENSYQYAFHCAFWPAAMQGDQVGSEVSKALLSIGRQSHLYDAAVVIRGGGSRLDLAGFDGLELCRVAAQLPLPLLTGIGHDSDETVLDRVAGHALKTPTAVAEFILQHNLRYETHMLYMHEMCKRYGRLHVQNGKRQIDHHAQKLAFGLNMRIQRADSALDAVAHNIQTQQRYLLARAHSQLEALRQLLNALEPDSVLRRGYSITYQNGSAVRSAQDVVPGAQLETRFTDGTVHSTVQHKN